jgi:hypothetical protein
MNLRIDSIEDVIGLHQIQKLTDLDASSLQTRYGRQVFVRQFRTHYCSVQKSIGKRVSISNNSIDIGNGGGQVEGLLRLFTWSLYGSVQ